MKTITKVEQTERRGKLHLSIDDVLSLLQELAANEYGSVWQHPVFHFLKRMHELYGAVFSLYCFNTNRDGSLKDIPTTYVSEFREAAGWLRFGFHGHSQEFNYSDPKIDAVTALVHYEAFSAAAAKFASPNAVDTVIRSHFFSGKLDVVRTWRDAVNGIWGLLTADDARKNIYYLDDDQRKVLSSRDYLFDPNEKLHFFRSLFRFEAVTDPVQELRLRVSNLEAYADWFLCVFTHETFLRDETIRAKIEDCCRWAERNDYGFAFPMDLVGR